jgi:hypothetical protein
MSVATRIVIALALLAAGLAVGGNAVAARGTPEAERGGQCRPWRVGTVARNLGVLENLEPDGRGGLLLSDNGANRIDRLSASGRLRTLIPDVPSPGGQRIRGHYLYFNTGDSAQAGVLGTTDGTIQRYNLLTGKRTTWATGLSMPNGLLFLPGGDAIVSRDSPGWGITRIPRANPDHPRRNWVRTDDSNGLTIDPTGTWVYFDQTFQPGNEVMRARIAHPRHVERVASLGNGLVADDMTIDRRGNLYIASNRPAPLGELVRLNPDDGRRCVIATGLGDPSAVKFGCGPGWSSHALYVTGFEGSVYEVRPPAGVRAPRGTCDAATGAR